jgi:hypothetical protein
MHVCIVFDKYDDPEEAFERLLKAEKNQAEEFNEDLLSELESDRFDLSIYILTIMIMKVCLILKSSKYRKNKSHKKMNHNRMDASLYCKSTKSSKSSMIS